jgi:subtilisin family serine protease
MEAVNYIEIAERIQPENNKMIRDVRADSVWNGFNLPKGFTGKNVLIGVTDWGFDYTHPMFMDTALSKTRIRAAWDHFKQTGAKPTGFDYGVVYQTPSDLATAQSDTAGTYYDYATHGSHVAGIAAGSGAGIGYRGVAFEAEFLFNSIQLDVGAAIDAFTWMQEIAQKDKKRLVINMSWGLYYLGTMDGTSILSEVIEEMSKEGVVFVTSGGNNGGVNFHIKKDFNNDSLRSRINFYGYSLHPSMWGQAAFILP